MTFSKGDNSDMTIEERFLEYYREVFTDDNKVRACGRDKCRKLIEAAKEINNNEKYGNTSTGLMNIDNIIKLHERIMGNKIV